MNFESLLAQGRLRPHRSNKDEIQEMLRLVDRDLGDAEVQGLSLDRRFLIAYEAGLNLVTIALYCSGYETHGQGHHWTTFQVLPHLMGSEYREFAEYMDLCRTKRNIGTYGRGGQISESEVDELLKEVLNFKSVIVDWLKANHPELI